MRRTLAALGAVAAGLLAGATQAHAAVSLAKVGQFNAPVYVAAPPGDPSRVLVVEKPGRIVQVTSTGAVSTFADLTSVVLDGPERGLLSIAFAPDFATSRKLDVFYTAKDGALTVDELTAAADGGSASVATRRNLLSIPHDRNEFENGGQIAYGPDGALYVGTGSGDDTDPADNAQTTSGAPGITANTNSDPRLGKILRLDPATGGPAAGNPGFGEPRIWAFGLRNPFRFSFDRATGDLTLADVGLANFEEIDFASAASGGGKGLNFGWHDWEGNRPTGSSTSRGGFTFPVLTLDHSEGYCAAIGGYVVRDPDVPELAGRYVYSDHCKGVLRSATLAGGAKDDAALTLTGGGLPSGSHPTSFGEDACARVYVTTLEGGVFRLTSGAGASCPAPAPAVPAGQSTGTGATTPAGSGLGLSVPAVKAQRVGTTGTLRIRAACSIGCTVAADGRFRVAGKTVSALRLRRTTRKSAAQVTTTLTLKVALSTRRRIVRELRRGRTVRAVVSVRGTAGLAKASKTLTVSVRR